MRRAIVPAVVRVANDVLAGEMTLVEDFAVALVDEMRGRLALVAGTPAPPIEPEIVNAGKGGQGLWVEHLGYVSQCGGRRFESRHHRSRCVITPQRANKEDEHDHARSVIDHDRQRCRHRSR